MNERLKREEKQNLMGKECATARDSPRTLRSRSSRAVLGKDLLLDSPVTENDHVYITCAVMH